MRVLGSILRADAAVDAAVLEVQAVLAAEKLGVSLPNLGVPPHLTLAVHEEEREAAAREALPRVAEQGAVGCVLASAAVFGGDAGVLFLAPVVTRSLLDLHARWHEAICGPSGWEDYRPGAWVPHVTLTTGLEEERLGRALEIAQASLPIRGRFARIELLSFVPDLSESPRWIAAADLAGEVV